MPRPVCAIIAIGSQKGEAFARRFSEEGYAVALLSRTTDLSVQLAEEIGNAASRKGAGVATTDDYEIGSIANTAG